MSKRLKGRAPRESPALSTPDDQTPIELTCDP